MYHQWLTIQYNSLHAVTSSQVTMQKVTPAEILHAQRDVYHELQESLSWQELRKKQNTSHY